MNSRQAAVPEIDAGDSCANCGTALQGHYCSACGQKAEPPDPTLHTLLHEATHEFLHLDGKIVQTLRLLFTQPGALTREYLQGRRVRYIGPIRVYLTMSLLYFLVSSLVPNQGVQIQFDKAPSATEATRTEPARVVPRLVAPMERGVEYLKEHPDSFRPLFLSASSKAMFVLLPVFALLLRLVYFRAGRRYPQYLYFALHYHAAIFGVFLIAAMAGANSRKGLSDAVWGLALIWAMLYLGFALKRVWGGSWASVAARSVGVLALYAMCLVPAVAGAVLYAFYKLGTGATTH